jgi:hypothetical protein
MSAPTQSAPDAMSPDDFRNEKIRTLENLIGVIVYGVTDHRSFCPERQLATGVEPFAADVQAFTRRANKMRAELAGMLMRMRIAPRWVESGGLRLVDNTGIE